MRFKRVYIEITNTCNLSCSFCMQNERSPRRMTREEFCHILEEVRPYTQYIYLHVLGEPLSHPDLDFFLTELERCHLNVHITTNGTLLKQQEEILKKHHIRQINVSLHSFPEHLHPTYFEDVFSVCEGLASQGVYINYRLWNLKEGNLHKSCQEILKGLCTHYAMDIAQEKIKRLQRIEIQPHLSLHFEELFEWPSLQHPYVHAKGRCLGMKDMCAILSNGDMVPCCLDGKGECVFGNLHEQNFKDLLQSERVTSMVHGFEKHEVKETLCQHCSYRLRFNRDRKEG